MLGLYSTNLPNRNSVVKQNMFFTKRNNYRCNFF